MKRTLLLVLLTLFVFASASAQRFEPGCAQLPGQLRTLGERRAIDNRCPRGGSGSSSSNAQNEAKNNFCASGQPVEVTIQQLQILERITENALRAANIPFGNPTSIPPNRDRLRQGFTFQNRTLREGMAVLFRGFVLEAHYSNVRKGENVNCNERGKPANDIHIALGSTPGADECTGITAEISPHFRPDSWADFDDYEFDHPVMLVGHLFYDASHLPCTGGRRASPARISSWEIHPVYSIFVCRNATLQACPANDASRWITFDQWVRLPDDEARNRLFGFLNLPPSAQWLRL